MRHSEVYYSVLFQCTGNFGRSHFHGWQLPHETVNLHICCSAMIIFCIKQSFNSIALYHLLIAFAGHLQ